MKCVKFIRYYSATKPPSLKVWKRWKNKERKIVRNLVRTMDSDLDYLENMYADTPTQLDLPFVFSDKDI